MVVDHVPVQRDTDLRQLALAVPVDPVDFRAALLHPAEPGLLPFGELVDRGVELAEHLGPAQLAAEHP